MNSPVHRIKQNMGYQSDWYNNPSHKWCNILITMPMLCRLGAGCHIRLGYGCHSVKVGRPNRTAFFGVGICMFSVHFVILISLLKLLI